MRAAIIHAMNLDIISINETHLVGEDTINLKGYAWFGNNRAKHTRAPKGSGGVGFCVNHKLIKSYKVNVIYKHDGILGLQFSHVLSGYIFVVFTCYIPPEKSTWGRDASAVYSQLLSQIYLCSEADAIYLCGDLNGRVGGLYDYVKEIDEIPLRAPLDVVINKHGESLIEFLKDSKFCIVNGRICPLQDNYTSVSTRGKAVVDYILVPHDCLQSCISFEVITPTQLVNKVGCVELIGERSRLPDHSMLYLELQTGQVNNQYDVASMAPLHSRGRMCRRTLPQNFLNSVRSQSELRSLNDSLQSGQTDLDKWYEHFCKLIHDEVGTVNTNSKQINNTGKKPKYPRKPYWNEELQILWHAMHKAEQSFLKHECREIAKRDLLKTFKEHQHTFDKAYRKHKRAYQRGQILHIEQIQTSNPQAFWKEINKLGPKRVKTIPLEVLGHDGNPINELSKVIKRWETDFKGLLCDGTSSPDETFYNEKCCEKIQRECEMVMEVELNNDDLNKDLSLGEVQLAIRKAKTGKATGIENLPNEILKSPVLSHTLLGLFEKCFDVGKIPLVWFKSVINPIFKSGDPRLPLNYRGISLLSTVYKLYSSILNDRLMAHLEKRNLLVDEQNGFRKDRACIDHLYTLCTIVRTRLVKRKPTFACFIDFSKAFDLINRDLLWCRLLDYGVNGKFYKSVQSLYRAPVACVKINDACTDWFPTPLGVKQGDNLSPTLFAVYINDLAQSIKALNCGVQYGGHVVSTFLYADDIVLLAENELDMQKMLSHTSEWCKKWRMSINEKKTNIVHFRNPRNPMSGFEFHLGQKKINYVNSYKYLGLYVDESMNFVQGSTVLSESAGRALGGVIGKIKTLKDVGFLTYTTLYKACVCPILDYGAGVWGHGKFPKSVTIHNRAIRYFLGVHKFAPMAAASGDTGWEPCEVRWKICIARLWNRLIDMNDNRLTKKVFNWDIQQNGPWAEDMHDMLSEHGLEEVFLRQEKVNIGILKDRLIEKIKTSWAEEIGNKPKLRSYREFKFDYKTEKYVLFNLSKKQRSLCAQTRGGILPLHLETGRFAGSAEEDRICQMCDLNEIENEYHFVLYCPLYCGAREELFSSADGDDILDISDAEIIRRLFEKHTFKMANYIEKAWDKRKKALYTK